MIEGLIAAADMAEFAASAKQREAVFYLQRGGTTRAAELRAQAQALLDIAKSFRVRASQTDTGDYFPIGDPGPGWERRRTKHTTEKVPIVGGFWDNLFDKLRGRG